MEPGTNPAWDDLVSDLYLATIDPAAQARLPGRLAALMGGTTASLWQMDATTGAVTGQPLSNLPAEAVADYRAHHYQHDPWAGAAMRTRFDTALRGGEAIEDADFARSVYYNEFGAKFDLFHMIGAQFALQPGHRAGIVSVVRSRREGAFDDRAVAAMQRVLPHIKGAFLLAQQLNASAMALRTLALDSFGVAAAVLDGGCQVLRINALAEQVPPIRAAMTRRDPHAALHVASKREQQLLAARVAAVARGGEGGQLRLSTRAGSFIATVLPVPRGLVAPEEEQRWRVLLLLKPLQRAGQGLTPALLTALFGMTKAEAAVAAALAAGHAPQAIATQRGVQVSTVRSLLQRAQDKAECRNLRDLARVLAAL